MTGPRPVWLWSEIFTTRQFVLTASSMAFAILASAKDADPHRAREAAAMIVRNKSFDTYCRDGHVPLPGFSDAETEAACEMIADRTKE